MGWDADFADQAYFEYSHPAFITGDNGITEFSVGATGEFEVYSYRYEGGTMADFHLDAAADENKCLVLDIEGNGYNHNDALSIVQNVGDLQPTDVIHSIHINIDEAQATSADATTSIEAIALDTTDSSAATKHGIHVGPGFAAALHVSGAAPIDPDYGYEVASGVVIDRVNSVGAGDDAFINTDADQQVFGANGDYILIGSDNKFEIIAINLDTNGSKDAEIEFYYSRAGGLWAQFFPSDSTNGFKNSGFVEFAAPALWTKDDEAVFNGDITDAYYIKMLRTRIPTYTRPIEDFIKIYTDSFTGMSIRGDGTIEPRVAADATVADNSIYYSITSAKLVFKDSGGVVNDLY
jgi:hypothetical protein